MAKVHLFAIVLVLAVLWGLLRESQLELKDHVNYTLQRQKGVLFAKGAHSYVYRVSYTGRSIIKPNSNPSLHGDSRGYVPVEWWIMSMTRAENDIVKQDEGLTILRLKKYNTNFEMLVTLKDAVDQYGDEQGLVGDKSKWPLTKILDIGGTPARGDFGDHKGSPEVPPIPCHIHRGYTHRDPTTNELIISGLPGKKEAYFFPPLDLPPYNKVSIQNAKTRLGLKPGVTREQVIAKLSQFGKDDSFYDLLTMYDVKPYEGWTIEPGILHAPGPYLTFEIQYPQDDFHFASWKFGEKLQDDSERQSLRDMLQLRGLGSEVEFVDKLVNWNLTSDSEFKERNYRPIEVLEEGKWGRRFRIFFDGFHGEGIEIEPKMKIPPRTASRAFAGLVWSGEGSINDNYLSAEDQDHREFLVVPNTSYTIYNSGINKLVVWTVFPLE